MDLKAKEMEIPRIVDIKEPQVVALAQAARAGTKILQSFLDCHTHILMIPGYPLMYLYPHWQGWYKQIQNHLSWDFFIDMLCEKHASILDSRRVPGLSGLERLGQEQNEHIEINEHFFKNTLRTLVDGLPVCRKTFFLAIHYAYSICRQEDVSAKTVLFYHIHYPLYLRELSKDFPDLKVINMIRNPLASIHSTARSHRIVGDNKLNETDSIIYSGRNFCLTSQLHFDTLDHLASCLRDDQVISIRLESLYEKKELVMKNLARWIGVEFSETMLQSTFDGKLWWGDVTNRKPVNDLYKNVATNKWKQSINLIDAFVIEGVSCNIFEKYNYVPSYYKQDNFWNRLLLFLAILLPNKAECLSLLYYLYPCTHMKVLRAALAEGTGRIPLKDYTWNATYLYKWFYLDLQLWRARWYDRFVSRNPLQDNQSDGPAVFRPKNILYIGAKYGLFWISILTFPKQIARRYCIFYRYLWRRLKGQTFLPPLLEEKQTKNISMVTTTLNGF